MIRTKKQNSKAHFLGPAKKTIHSPNFSPHAIAGNAHRDAGPGSAASKSIAPVRLQVNRRRGGSTGNML
jgi:hypothetical protein